MITNDMKIKLRSDIEFIYNGKNAAFCPIGIFVIGYAGDAHEYSNLEQAVNAKVFDGKSLVEIWDDILPQIT